jgi:hypothetical protein
MAPSQTDTPRGRLAPDGAWAFRQDNAEVEELGSKLCSLQRLRVQHRMAHTVSSRNLGGETMFNPTQIVIQAFIGEVTVAVMSRTGLHGQIGCVTRGRYPSWPAIAPT